MPKTDRKGNYVLPSGRTWTPKQAAYFYASNGFKKPVPAEDGTAEGYSKAAMAREAASRLWRK